MTSTNGLTDQQLAAIDAREKAATEGPWCTDSWEIYQGTEYLPGISQWIGETCRGTSSPEQDRADAEFVAHARTDVRLLLAEVRRQPARMLTESEYSAAWHAVEGAAGEEGADPGTILHAVLDRLGITCPGTDEQPAAETPDEPAPWPTFTLERWDWTTSAWDTHATYGPDERGEGNAYFAVSSERASNTGPIRLLKNGVPMVADDPATFYADTGW